MADTHLKYHIHSPNSAALRAMHRLLSAPWWLVIAWMALLLPYSVALPPAGGSGTASSSRQHADSSFLQEMADEVQKAKQSIRETLEDMSKHSTLAGSFKPAIGKLLLTPEEADLLWRSIRATAHWEDLLVILLVGWSTVPLLRAPYDLFNPPGAFRQSYWFLVADHLQQIARIALVVYLVDIVKMFCIGIGFDFCKLGNVPHVFAQSAYTLWMVNRLAVLKKYLLRQYVSRHPETFGRMQILNRLLDAAVYGLGLFVILNVLQVEMGVAMQSILAFGSVSTLALGLASQGIATQVLNGLMLASSDRIYEGDQVVFANGQAGTIVKLGWMETVLRGSDEVMVSIPNADFLKQHVSNLSRIRYCQVKQTLRFRYDDASKLPSLLKSIKEEIQLACPEVITDGSRPFRAHWTDLADDHLTVVVDAHFYLKPVGDAYWDNRQRVLQAIYRAAKINQVQFAVPPDM